MNRGRTTFWRAAAPLTASLWLVIVSVNGWAHPPLPGSVLDPRTAPEAWNVLRLAAANIEFLLRDNRLAEVPDQVSLCSPALRALVRLAPPGQQSAVAEHAVHASGMVSSVAQAAMAGDFTMTVGAFGVLRTDLRDLGKLFDPATVNAEIYFCPMHPDVLRTDASAHCDRCGMTLVRRAIPYSFIYMPPGEPTMRIAVDANPPLVVGTQSCVTLRLSQRDGSPVRPADLEVVHTQPIHLLIVDSALEDYHHEHPVVTNTPGEYVFSFTPARSSGYRVFADLVPKSTGTQEYPHADLAGAVATPAGPPPHGENTQTCEAGGLRFLLSDSQSDTSPLRTRQTRSLRITVNEADGKPTNRLEPVMNAFAHLVGFYDDGRTVVHVHPQGGEITDPAQRGGPSLDFRFYPPKAGFLRLFCQVQVDGKAIYAPFNVNVQP